MNIKELIEWSEKIESERSKVIEHDQTRAHLISSLEKWGITELLQPHTRKLVKVEDCNLYSLVLALEWEVRRRGVEQGFQQCKGAYLT